MCVKLFFVNIVLFLEVKLDTNDQLFMSLEGNTICEKNQKYKTEITFVCNKNVSFNIKYFNDQFYSA